MPYDSNNNPKILNEHWITLQLWYISMSSSVVLIYQQQKCVFATVGTIFNSVIAPELTIIEIVGGVTIFNYLSLKVRKTAKFWKWYNQSPHLTKVTTWESSKNTINIDNKSQEVSPFQAGDQMAAMCRHKNMRNTKHKWSKKKNRLGTVSKIILLEGLNRFHSANLSLSSSFDPET